MTWYIATAMMVADHIGALVLPQFLTLRIVGRLAYPLFAISMAAGMQKTKDPWAYLGRVAFLALPSEAVHHFAFGGWGSPLLMLLTGGLILQAPAKVQQGAILAGVLLGPWVGPWVLPTAAAWGALPTALVILSHAGANWVQGLAVLAIPAAAWLRNEGNVPQPPRWAKYGMYPAHLAAIKAFAFLT